MQSDQGKFAPCTKSENGSPQPGHIGYLQECLKHHSVRHGAISQMAFHLLALVPGASNWSPVASQRYTSRVQSRQ